MYTLPPSRSPHYRPVGVHVCGSVVEWCWPLTFAGELSRRRRRRKASGRVKREGVGGPAPGVVTLEKRSSSTANWRNGRERRKQLRLECFHSRHEGRRRDFLPRKKSKHQQDFDERRAEGKREKRHRIGNRGRTKARKTSIVCRAQHRDLVCVPGMTCACAAPSCASFF